MQKNQQVPQPTLLAQAEMGAQNALAPSLILIGAQWSAEEHVATALVVADLSLSPRLATAALAFPEFDIATVATAILRSRQSIERVAGAVERATRAKLATLEKTQSNLWNSARGEEIASNLMEELRESAFKLWPLAWHNSHHKTPLPGSQSEYWRLIGRQIQFSVPAFDAGNEAIKELLASIAHAATDALADLVKESWGDAAFVLSRSVDPNENEKDGLKTDALVLAAMEKSALQRAARLPGGGRDAKKEPSRVAASRQIAAHLAPLVHLPLAEAATPPRAMLAWELSLTSFSLSAEPLSVVAGVDLAASSAMQSLMRLAPHLSIAEAAAALVRSDSIISRLVESFARFAQEEGVSIKKQDFGEVDLKKAEEEIKKAWAYPSARLSEYEAALDAHVREQGVSPIICWSPIGAFPEIKTSQEDERRAFLALGERLAQEMQEIARAVFGAKSVVFARPMGRVSDAVPLLVAHAQKIAVGLAMGQEEVGEPAEEASRRKPRAL